MDSDVDTLLKRIGYNPFDEGAWIKLLKACESMPIQEARVHYRRCLTLFPTAGWVVRKAVDAEFNANETNRAETLLRQHIVNALDCELYKSYTDFVLYTNLQPALAAYEAASKPGVLPSEFENATNAVQVARTAVLEAFEFAVNQVGCLPQAGTLWKAYCEYVSTLPTSGEYAPQTLKTRREVYQKAMAMPHEATDEIWEEYCDFERKSGPEKLAEDYINKHVVSHATSSACAKERQALWKGILSERYLPCPPPNEWDIANAYNEDAMKELREQKEKFQARSDAIHWALSYELSNPLTLPPEALRPLLLSVFRASLSAIQYDPALWSDYSLLLQSHGEEENPFAEALQALPHSTLLSLVYADSLELSSPNEADQVYTNLLHTLHIIADRKGGARAAGVDETLKLIDSLDPTDSSAFDMSAYTSLPSVSSGFFPAPAQAVAMHPCIALSSTHDSTEAARAIPMIYILQQRYARRVSGIDKARQVFANARKSAYCTPSVYLASAKLEYYALRSAEALHISRNLIEAARKRWPSDIDLALSSVDFLTAVDEPSNVRLVINSFLGSLPAASSRPLLDRLIAYESNFSFSSGALQATVSAETRRAQQFPHLTGVEVRSILKNVHRWTVDYDGNMGYLFPPVSSVDAVLLEKHGYQPCGTILVKKLRGEKDKAPENGVVTLATNAGLVEPSNDPNTAKMEGLYLQAPPSYVAPMSSLPVSHISIPYMFHAMRKSQGTESTGAGANRSIPSELQAIAAGSVAIPDFLKSLLSLLPAYDASIPANTANPDSAVILSTLQALKPVSAGTKRGRND